MWVRLQNFPIHTYIHTFFSSPPRFVRQSTSAAMAGGVIKAALADGLLTFMWIFCASALGALTYIVASTLGVEPGFPYLIITTSLIFTLLFIFGFIGDLLGGASFNPTATAAFMAAGLGGADSLVSAAVRLPAQVLPYPPLD